MNALIPAFLAVLLAEAGRARRDPRDLFLIALTTMAAVALALFAAPYLPPRTRALLIGVSLLVAALDQATLPPKRLIALRSAAPGLAFALALWGGVAWTVGIGAFAGAVAAAFAPPLPWLRRSAAALLALAGTFALLGGLHLT